MTTADPGQGRDMTASETPRADEALRWLQQTQSRAELLGAVRSRLKRRRQRQAGLMATLCVALAAGGFAWRHIPADHPASTGGVAAAAAGSSTAILTFPSQEILPDGSIVELRDGAEIGQHFTGAIRRVSLVRGEAHFQVARNVDRPFIVTARDVEIRAVGTAFSVQVDRADVEVVVTQGRVAVDARRSEAIQPGVASFAPGGREHDDLAHPARTAILDAGDRGLIRQGDATADVSHLSESELRARLAWRVPRLNFSGTPLPEIVEILNRHAVERGRQRLVLDPDDPRLNQVKVSGVLAADNTDGLVRLLERDFNVQAENRPDHLLLRLPR
jgi:transmembrane sensor